MAKLDEASRHIGPVVAVIAVASGTVQSALAGRRVCDATVPNAIIRASRNLTKPLAGELVPKNIFDSTGTLVARITDAEYCGRERSKGRILAQPTAGSDTHAAANLSMADCSRSLNAMVARHQNATGVSSVASLTVMWSAWSLVRAVVEVAPVTQNALNADQLAAL
jgi:hypothetical protein